MVICRLFVGCFRFFVCRLRFFVCRLGLLVGRLRFFVGWFRFLCRFNITNGGWFMNRVVVGRCGSMNTCGMGMIAASGHRICHSMVGCIGIGMDIAKGWWGMDRVVGSIDRCRRMIGFRFFVGRFRFFVGRFRFFVGRFGFFVGRFRFFVSRLRSFGGCYIAKGGRSVDRMMVGIGRSRCLVRSGLWFFIGRLWLLSNHFGLFWGFRLRLFRSSLRFFVGRLRFGRFLIRFMSR